MTLLLQKIQLLYRKHRSDSRRHFHQEITPEFVVITVMDKNIQEN